MADINSLNNRPILYNENGPPQTEFSITVTNPRLNNGRPTNIPSIWGGKHTLTEDDAVTEALRSGQTFQPFNSIEEAVDAAEKRSKWLAQGLPSQAKQQTGIEKMKQALRNAHNAGDTAAAGRIAGMIKTKMEAEGMVREMKVENPESRDPHAPLPSLLPGEIGPPTYPTDGIDPGRSFYDGQVPDRTGLADKGMVMGTNMMEGIPIIGPPLRKSGQYARAAYETTIGDMLSGQDTTFDQRLRAVQAENQQRDEQNANLALGSQLAGSVASTGGAAMTQAGGRALGLGGKTFGGRVAGASASGGSISAADTAMRGGDAQDIAISGGIGATGGAAIPVIGAGLRAGGRYIGGKAKDLVAPRRSAQDRVVGALRDDMADGTTLRPRDIQTAGKNAQPVTVGDMGGENTRALARSAANNSPSARNALGGLSQRFGQQNDRATSFVSKLVKGKANDVDFQDELLAAARAKNKPAYEKAYAFNYGKEFPRGVAELMDRVPASAMRSAMKIAKAEGRPMGEQLVASIDDGLDKVTFSRLPSMRELDYIQRGLRTETGKAFRAEGGGGVGTAYKALHKELLERMDSVNPMFKEARQGAAAAFGADDAIEAGRKAASGATSSKVLFKSIAKMSDPEKEAFRIGYAGKIIDRIGKASDRSDVINSVFGNPESRQKMTLIFGAKKAKEVEAFVRIEHAMKLFQNAVQGNSTTARQLMEIGLGGATGGYLGGDWQSAATGAAIGAGGRAAKGWANNRIASEVGEMLMQQTPEAMEKLIQQATTNRTTMAVIRDMERNLLAAGVSVGPAISAGSE